MSLFDDLKKIGENSFADKFKQFGHSDEDADLSQNVAQKVKQNVKHDDNDDDELEKAQNAHKKIYDDKDHDHDDTTLGKAAAFEAFKKYNSGEKSEKDKVELEKHFVAMAISEGLNIWKKKNPEQGEGAAGQKEKIMEQAATAAIKMLAKSEKSGKSEKTEKTESSETHETKEDSHSKLTDLAKKFF